MRRYAAPPIEHRWVAIVIRVMSGRRVANLDGAPRHAGVETHHARLHP
jgi:hypothetical protein